jgi:hypothetical protein
MNVDWKYIQNQLESENLLNAIHEFTNLVELGKISISII